MKEAASVGGLFF